MRLAIIENNEAGDSRVGFDAEVQLTPQPNWADQPMEGVSTHTFFQSGQQEMLYVEIKAGGFFVMHDSPWAAFCQVIHGKGLMQTSDGRGLHYDGPTTILFQPDTMHGWTDVVEDTLMSVAIMAPPTADSADS